MSIDATHWAWRQFPRSSTAKLLLLALSELADEAWCCSPPMKVLKRRMHMPGDATVRYYLDELVRDGLIRISDHPSDRLGIRKRYHINPPTPDSEAKP